MSLSTDPRPSPFTLAEFSDLVSSAFNIHDPVLTSAFTQPLLSLTPASPISHSSTFDPEHSSDDEDAHPSSFDAPSSHLSPPNRKSRSRTVNALRMFRHVRTRASAFVLRSRAHSPSRSPSPPPFQPLPLPSISPTPSSLSRALSPLSMVDLSRDRPRSRAESLPRSLFSLPKRGQSPPPLPALASPLDTRSPTPVLRSFFDDSPARSKHAYTRPAPSASSSTLQPLSRITTTSSTQSHRTVDSLPSFFEDNGYQVSKPFAPSYSRPATPPVGPQRAHTRLPPLRKSRSNGHGLIHRRSHSKSTICQPPVGLGYQDLALWNSHHDDSMPSPLTRPRDAPPVPQMGVIAALAEFDVDDDEPPLPPPYVFERRGSAASASTGSTRSTSSLSARLSNLVGLAFPSKMRTRGRSKLNLSIATRSESSSADSSPSTLSSHSVPSTPSSPTSAFSHAQPQVYAASADGHVRQSSSEEREEDAVAIGRVLTPEVDPFAKAEIAVSLQGTPRPPTPPLSRAASLQHSPCLDRTGGWSGERQDRKTRSSLPATPVSAAFTFPSSCSIYPDQSSYEHPSNAAPLARSATSTPKRQGPPSAWSPFTPPATPSNATLPSTPPSSQTHSPRSPQSLSRASSHRSTRPKCLVFPLPPSGLPPPFPPPDRALPDLPSTPNTPPVPPKDRIARAHKSLPPSPHPSSIVTSGSPLSVRSHGSVRHWKHLPGKLMALAERHESAVIQEVPSSLAEPWSGAVSNGDWPSRPETPVTSGRSIPRRRSVDSTCTVTASPTSSAMHDAAQGWEYECDAISIDGDALLEGDSRSMAGGSDTLSSITSGSITSGSVQDTDVFWSPVTSQSSVFYSVRGSLESSRTSLSTGDNHRARSLDTHAVHVPVWRRGKSASAGPCV